MKGKLINFEGISGIGKTFYSNLLKTVLTDEMFVFHKEIMDSEHKNINKKIFEILMYKNSKFFDIGNPKLETLLLASKQVNDEENTIIPSLNQNKYIISDRGLDSICVYQGIMFAKKYGGDNLNYSKKIYKSLKNICIIPDKTILLTGDFYKAIARAEKRDNYKYTQEEIEILKKADYAYKKIAKNNKKRYIIINVDLYDTEEIKDQLIKIITEL